MRRVETRFTQALDKGKTVDLTDKLRAILLTSEVEGNERWIGRRNEVISIDAIEDCQINLNVRANDSPVTNLCEG